MLKPGWRTTEFVVTVLVSVGAVVAAFADALTPRYAAIASAVSVAAYAIARGLAKNGATRPPVPPGAPPS
jgi:hypothetical protein